MPELRLPERINRLEELANNLWWSWHPQARALFRALDYPLWHLGGHNPVKQLREISADRLEAAANDPAFLNLYDSVMAALDADISAHGSWFASKFPDSLPGPVAYFSMEFAIHNSLPIYAGGLGILAGDVCKEASDLGLPLVGVGFMYPQGYFHQHVSTDGWQEEVYRQLDFDEAPITPINPATRSTWCGPLVELWLGDRPLHIGAWQVHVGRVDIYLLCCDLEQNRLQDRQLCARLYVADQEQRIQQEIVLGIGGVRALRALGINPSVWHANEGHSAFMMLERVREEVEKGMAFTEALQRVRATTVFTTHTPAPAGQDIFPTSLVEKYCRSYWDSLAISRETFLELGREDGASDQAFNMSVFALKMADYRNAVSERHGKTARRMWHRLWPDVKEDEVPITHITNGIHVPTWLAPEMAQLYEKYLGQDISKRYDDVGFMKAVLNIPDEELWEVRQILKRKLLSITVQRARQCASERVCTARQMLGMGGLLEAHVLTIGFVRRFTEYKRPALIFYDIDRLKRIVTDKWRPVQIIFAGKSHPADFASKQLLHQVYTLATGREFQGRIAFVEDYDMHMARYLVQGVDVWLNTPRRFQEACGTSGMKAAVNGVLHLSVRDGWWYEGFNGANGWAIGGDVEAYNPAEEDKLDAEALYRLLEGEIVPLYYERNRAGVPVGWMRMVKEAIGSIGPVFCTRRMLKEYTERMYIPAARGQKLS
ncbi:MAG: alpha-glucan family phosphorylase [Dehalococcoidia bacterium]